MGKSRELYQQYTNAAEVALKSGSQLPDLIDHVQLLVIIHRAPESDWPALVEAMLRGKGGRKAGTKEGNRGGIAEWARGMGKSRDSVQEYVEAARVAEKHVAQAPGLVDYTKSLSIIHRAPESDWAALVEAMLRGKGGRGKKGGIAEWALPMGKTAELYGQYANAARVALKVQSQLLGLIDHVQLLVIIHRAPESDWPALVEAMLKGEW